MDILVLKRVIMHLILCGIFIALVFVSVKIYFSIIYEKRIKEFALEPKGNDEYSIMDIIINFFRKIIKFNSKILKKSHFFSNYAKHFDKYLIYNDSSFLNIDYISIKFLVMVFIQILYLFTLTLKLNAFNIYSFILLSIVSFFLVDIILILLYKNEKKLIEEQLLQAIVIMNSAFKSGKNITEAITIVRNELPSPIKDEFDIIYKDITYGLSLKEAFNRFYDRVKLEEAKYITSSLSLLSKTGGSIVTVFNMIERNFYDRLRIKNELNALTSTSKLLYRALLIMPFIFILVIILLNPTYFTPLVSSKIGFLVDIIMMLLYIFYIVIIRKIMKVEEV